AELQDQLLRLSEVIRIERPRTAPLSSAREHYERLLEASRQRRKIRLRYESLYEQQVIRTLVSPYTILFKRHAWYVLGRSSLHRAVRTFHVGRILESELTDDTFELPPRFSIKRHFGKAWSMVREKKARHRVTVRFQPLVARNVADVIWHPSQQIAWNDDGTMDYSVEVDGLREMSWWIMGYADQAEVLEPDEMRELIAERVRKMSVLYRKRRT
ncbi:MAG: WYL domain-containing protein, partial [Planctomycetaceae bacterium]|nr:WYL domain-containing protein [Planctomycetaceae bacterium]